MTCGGSQESEIKVILTEEEAGRLREHLGAPARTVHQISYFFETPQDHFASKEIALRLREEHQPGDSKQQLLLTVKEAGVRAGALVVRPEYECHLDRTLWDGLLSGARKFHEVDLPPIRRLKAVLGKLEYLEIEKLGQIANTREIYDYAGDGMALELLLDRTVYPNGSFDTELESEMPQGVAGKAARLLRTLFAQTGIDWRPAEDSKYARFRRRIGRDPASSTRT
jgi:uncharacterized protein YjbK